MEGVWRVYGENEREREWDLGEKEAEKGPGSGRGAQSIKCPAETFSALYEISAFFFGTISSSALLVYTLIHSLLLTFCPRSRAHSRGSLFNRCSLYLKLNVSLLKTSGTCSPPRRDDVCVVQGEDAVRHVARDY